MNFFKKIGVCVVTGWKLIKETWQIVTGLYIILDLTRPCVSIFGGSRLLQDSSYSQDAYAIAAKLVAHGISVLTGGGPGIMEAGNCGAGSGAHEKGEIVTMGIGVRGLEGQDFNKCAGKTVLFDYFFSRKWLLINYSMGFVVFPGGFGTVDELSDLLNQMQTGKLHQSPVILIGTSFWKPYQDWMEQARNHQLLASVNVPQIVVTDDLDHAVSILLEHRKKMSANPTISKVS